MERPDPARLRISDEDRHKVTEVLRLAAGEGRIDLDELDERLEATYAAKTYADLVPITSDLPASSVALPAVPHVSGVVHPPVPAVTTYESSIAVVGETKRRGQWIVPPEHSAFATLGTVQLDLREAAFTAREVTINAYAILGEVKIIVNAHTRVFVDGVAVMAQFGEDKEKVPAELTAESQIVRVRGVSVMGNVSVQRRGMPGTARKRLGWSR